MRQADTPALRALERASPERGAVPVRLDLLVPHADLAARSPDARGYGCYDLSVVGGVQRPDGDGRSR